MEKINIAEILKDCPKGMELDSPVWNNIEFEEIDGDNIVVYRKLVDAKIYLTQYGKVSSVDGKCVIFPKDKTTWEGFVSPCKFKDGDIVVTTLGNIAIIRKLILEELFYIYGLMVGNVFYKNETAKVFVERLATEEEKQKLFDAIKANGYKWNPETKTLKKLVEPIFEVGNKIEKCGYRFTIAEVKENHYLTKCGNKIPFDNQDDFSLVPDKFDINTLKPFKSEVLVRTENSDIWEGDIFVRYDRNATVNKFHCIGGWYEKCIPFKGNEWLLGTTDNCEEYYKTWEK